MATAPLYLKRYTNLANAIHMLASKKLSFSNPIGWHDKNDIHFLQEYKRLKPCQSLLALCFMELKAPTEKFHHWNVFTNRTDGVCIHFDKDEFLRSVPDEPNYRSRSVKYLTIEALNQPQAYSPDDLPFLKRVAYQDENEFRLIFEHKSEEILSKEILLDLSSIKQIVVGPWIPDDIYKTIKKIISIIDGCSKIKITKSRLIQSEAWMKFTKTF